MKKFEMPVVVLNEMTMNESIASDCCYKLVTEGLVTTKTILNGGTSGTSTTYPLKASVVAAFGSRTNMPNYHYKVFIPNVNFVSPTVNPIASFPGIGETGVISGGGTAGKTYDVLSFTTYPGGGTISYVAYLDGDNAIEIADPSLLYGAVLTQNGGACDHFGSSCPFVTKTELKNAHIGATMKHLFGGTNWDQPHTAQQYNS